MTSNQIYWRSIIIGRYLINSQILEGHSFQWGSRNTDRVDFWNCYGLTGFSDGVGDTFRTHQIFCFSCFQIQTLFVLKGICLFRCASISCIGCDCRGGNFLEVNDTTRVNDTNGLLGQPVFQTIKLTNYQINELANLTNLKNLTNVTNPTKQTNYQTSKLTN